MEIKYELYNSDYVDSAAAASRSRMAVFIAQVLLAGCSFVGGVTCCVTGYFLPAVVLLFLSWFFVIKRIYGWATVRHPHKMDPDKDKDEVILFLRQDGLEYQHPVTNLQARWNDFSHFLEDDLRFLLIFRRQRVFLIVPKRAFCDQHQLEHARRYFEIITNSTPTFPQPHS